MLSATGRKTLLVHSFWECKSQLKSFGARNFNGSAGIYFAKSTSKINFNEFFKEYRELL